MCYDRLSNPLFCLTLVLSTFLAISAAVLFISEYWGVESETAAHCLSCASLEEGAGVLEAKTPKGWEFLKEKQILLVASELSYAGVDRVLGLGFF